MSDPQHDEPSPRTPNPGETPQKRPKRKVLQVIHGFPPYYMAGSEVYTYKLCRELAKTHEVVVFSRVEDPYAEPYSWSKETYQGIPVYRLVKNQRDYLYEDKYLDPRVDAIFAEVLDREQPDIVHFGHLSHLSTNLVSIVKARDIPVVFTLHDFWMQCLRGQRITPLMIPCEGPSPDRCVECMAYYFRTEAEGTRLYRDWDAHSRAIMKQVDLLIAPSQFLRDQFIAWGIPPEKILYQDYGFDTSPFEDFSKSPRDPRKIRFGFMGRIIPVKGIDLLIRAINHLDPTRVVLNIYGGANGGESYLRKLVKHPGTVQFRGKFHNDEITKVFGEIDVLVVPSIWYENSPLVIHEAFLAGVPVVTSNLGGMAELVHHGQNGLLFDPGSEEALVTTLQRFLDDPDLVDTLVQPVTPVRTMEEEARDIAHLYEQCITTQRGKEPIHNSATMGRLEISKNGGRGVPR